MSVTKKNHYLSQCIIKNFITENNQTFWVYDCGKGGEIYQRNVSNMFYGRHIWEQDVENSIHDNFEERIVDDLREILSWDISAPIIPGPKGLTVPQFSCKVIDNKTMRDNLNKLILQCVLVQANWNAKERNNIVPFVNELFSRDTKGLELMLTLVEIFPNAGFPPLVLTDLLLFMFAVPNDEDKNFHLCFCVPISTTRMIIWGSKQDILHFCEEYKNVNYLNLCRIEQQSKACLIASQDKEYLSWLASQIEFFHSKEKMISIRSERGTQIKW